MKIYVVTQGMYSDYHIITATTNENLAKEIAKKFDREYDPTDIEVFEDAKIMLKPCWLVRFNKDGSVKEVKNASDDAFHYQEVNKCKIDWEKGVVVSVLANNPDAAIKIASEKRAQFLAEKAGIC